MSLPLLRTAWTFSSALLLCLSACEYDRTGQPAHPEAAFGNVISLQRQIFRNGISAGADTVRAYPFVRAVEGFSENYPDHDSVANLLMRAAGVANATGWSSKSIQLWGQVWRRFPTDRRAPEAMFNQGFVLDNKYKDYRLASRYYDRLIRTYPRHSLSQKARELRQLAGRAVKLPPAPDTVLVDGVRLDSLRTDSLAAGRLTLDTLGAASAKS